MQSDADNAESKGDLARANGNLGNLLLMGGNSKEVLSHLNASIKTFGEICPRDTDNFQLPNNFAQTGDWLRMVNDRHRKISQKSY